jgi:hypothetical protein
VEVSDKYFVLVNGGSKLNLDGNKVEPVNISYTFEEIFLQSRPDVLQAWAQMEQNYYDENSTAD